MAAPFGFSVGDFIAVGQLIQKISVELRENGEAAPEYQHLLVELEALNRALNQLQILRPRKHELLQLTAIRAAALSCQLPLQEFLNKISKFDPRLGIANAGDQRLRGLHRRMQWRLAYKDEVKELRAKLGSHVATINLLLMTQAVSSITAAENDREEATCGLHEKIRAHRMLLDEVKSGVDSSLARQLGTKLQLEAQANTLGTLNCKADQTMLQLRNEQVLIDEVKKAASKTEENTKSLLVMATDTLSQATLGLLTLRDIAVKLCYLAASITKFTVEMREAIALLTRQFAGIYKVLRAVEASLPRRIFLPIVHFTDALGETFALPYQVCMQWKTFRLMLHALFHQRPGQSRVEMGNFLIMHAAGSRLLQEGSWNHAIKEGDHLEMSMILDGHFTTGDFCPFPSCQASLLGGEVSNGGITCSKCRRWVLLVERRMPPAVAPAERNTSEDDSREWNSEEEDLNEDRTDEKNQSPKENIVEDIELYRKVNVVRAQATASQPNRFNSGPEEWLACWREAQRADKVAEGLLRIRTILDLEFYDQISATLREVESTSRILRDLYDLFPFYRSRVPFIICYLNVIIPSLCRTLKEMTLYLEHENLPARAQWTLMSDRLSQQGGMTLAARFVMYVELLIQLVRLLSRSPLYDPTSLELLRLRHLRLRDLQRIPTPSTPVKCPAPGPQS